MLSIAVCHKSILDTFDQPAYLSVLTTCSSVLVICYSGSLHSEKHFPLFLDTKEILNYFQEIPRGVVLCIRKQSQRPSMRMKDLPVAVLLRKLQGF